MPNATRDDVMRRFWATFLEVEVRTDGQVPGFARWMDGASPFAARRGPELAEWCWIKSQRDGRDVDECVAASVAYFRDDLRLYRPAAPRDGPTHEEVAALVAIIGRHVDGALPSSASVGRSAEREPLRLTAAQVSDAQEQRQRLLDLGLAPGLANETTIPTHEGG